MKIAFFWTPDFAWEILSWILEFPEIDCCLVVSQPDKPVWRKKILDPTPVKQIAMNAGIEVMQPEKIKKNTEFHKYLNSLELDFIVVVAYGKIIPQAILDIPKYGCINIHGSILPQYRWASPVQAAVKAWDRETWLTTMYMSAGMDEWDILKIAKVDIDKVDTSIEIFKKFIEIGPELLKNTLTEILSWTLVWIPQYHADATHCGKISREDGEVFFSRQSSEEIYNTYRAYTPWPGIYTWYEGKRLVLEQVSIFKNEEKTLWETPCELVKLWKNRYWVVCADKKILEIQRVKLEGKKSMDIMSFVNGNREVVWYKFK